MDITKGWFAMKHNTCIKIIISVLISAAFLFAISCAGTGSDPGGDGAFAGALVFSTLGELPDPSSSNVGQLYYVIAEGNFYYSDGSDYVLIDLTGPSGSDGISINWLGSLASAPGSPALNDAYYNSTDGIAYIWDGDSWEILAQDGSGGGAVVESVNFGYTYGETINTLDAVVLADLTGEEVTDIWNGKIYDSGLGYDYAVSVAIDSNNNIYVAGYKNNGTDLDWWVRKFDSAGTEDTVNWDKVYDSGSGDDYASSVAVDSNDNIYVAGSKHNGTDFDLWIRKFDSAGTEDTVNWDKVYDSGLGDDYARSVAIDSNNNVYVAGHKNNGTDLDWWIKKFDSAGTEDTVNWDKVYDSGSGDDYSSSVAVDSNNNIYVAGYKNNGADFDWWIKKFDSAGTEDTVNWDKVYDSGSGDDCAVSVAVDSNNNIYVAGYKHNGTDNDWWIKKFDSAGTEDTVNWDKVYDSGLGNDFAQTVVIDSNNYVYVGGNSWIRKFDSGGNEDTSDWAKVVDYRAMSMSMTAGNNILIAGCKNNGTDEDWMLKKYFTGEMIIRSNISLPYDYYYLGFALEAGIEGDTGKQIQIAGTVSGFSGLQPGLFYYLSDTPGQISLGGSYSEIAGIALSATELTIEK
jgi:uncharacterized delta-60 repeat protein